MTIETLELPKPEKSYDWRCCNESCHALLRATRRDASCILYKDGADHFEFECPHCLWRTTVPK